MVERCHRHGNDTEKCLEGMPLSEEDEGPGGDVTVREKEGPRGYDIDTEEESVGITLPQKDQGVNNQTRYTRMTS